MRKLVLVALFATLAMVTTGCGENGLESITSPTPTVEVPPTSTQNRVQIDSRSFRLNPATPTSMSGGVSINLPTSYRSGKLEVSVIVQESGNFRLRTNVIKYNDDVTPASVSRAGDFHFIDIENRSAEVGFDYSLPPDSNRYGVILQAFQSDVPLNGSVTIYYTPN